MLILEIAAGVALAPVVFWLAVLLLRNIRWVMGICLVFVILIVAFMASLPSPKHGEARARPPAVMVR